MITPRFTNVLKAAIPTILLALTTGCGAAVEEEENEEAAEIAAAIELENGGLTMADELPMFGTEEMFSEAGLPDAEVAYDDVIDQSAEVVAMRQAPDAVVFHTTVLWGQFPGNPGLRAPRNWSGTLTVSRGAVIVNRTVLFEGPTDHLLPRNNPRVVPFTSATLPHHDGLRLTIIDPEPFSGEPQVLTYSSANGPEFSAPMPALTDGPQSQIVDDRDNRIVAVAVPQPVDVCNHGMLGGRWHRVAEGRGRFLGPVADAGGHAVGHVHGIYGKRRNGERVFFGKYINRDGEFRGIFGGHYGGGHFEGRWLSRSGEVGALGGEYRETIPGPEVGGHFLGRWAELSCNLPVGPGAPVPR